MTVPELVTSDRQANFDLRSWSSEPASMCHQDPRIVTNDDVLSWIYLTIDKLIDKTEAFSFALL